MVGNSARIAHDDAQHTNSVGNMALAVSLALLVISALVFHGEGGKIPEAQEKCCRKLLDGVDPCCRLPEVLAEQSMADCTEGAFDKTTDPSQPADFLTPVDVIGNPCTTDCAFHGQKFYTADGMIDARAVLTVFTANVSASWRPILETSVNECTATANAVPNPTDSSCNPRAEVFMTCCGRSLVSNCAPDSSFKTADGCTSAKLDAVKSCDLLSPCMDTDGPENDPDDDELPSYMQKEKTLAKGGVGKGSSGANPSNTGTKNSQAQQKKVLPLNPKSSKTKKPKVVNSNKKKTTQAPLAKNVGSAGQQDKKKPPVDAKDSKKKVALEIPKG